MKWPAWTGKPQRPVELSGEAHDCPKFAGKGGKYQGKSNWAKYDLTTKSFDFCEFCGRQPYTEETFEKYPDLFGLTLEEHIEQYHPNGEILDWIDFKALTPETEKSMREKFNYPKRTGKFYLVNKHLRQEETNDIFIG